MKLYAVLAAIVLALTTAMQIDPTTGVPLRADIQKSVCATYTVKGETVQRAIVYPSFIAYEAIGQSGAYWIYWPGGRLRADSLVFSPLYGDGENGPTSCTP